MAEIPGRWVTAETNRYPAASSYALYYTASDPIAYGIDVCNGEASDAHISIWIIPASAAYIEGDAPPPYSIVHKNQRVESDGTDGNGWVMPVKTLNAGDRVVVWTDLVGVTFYGHGYKITA